MKILKNFFIILVIFILIFVMTGCGQKINKEEVRKYSDNEVESLLVSLKNDDYKEHSKNYSTDMINAMNEDKFKQMSSSFKEKIGEYESKEFLTIQSKGDYIVTIYKAKFTKEPVVIVSVTFKPNDLNHLIYGEFYSSSKLSK